MPVVRCSNCVRWHRACDRALPCSQCIGRNIQSTCSYSEQQAECARQLNMNYPHALRANSSATMASSSGQSNSHPAQHNASQNTQNILSSLAMPPRTRAGRNRLNSGPPPRINHTLPLPFDATRGKIFLLVNPSFRGLHCPIFRGPFLGFEKLYILTTVSPPPGAPPHITLTPAAINDPVTQYHWKEDPKLIVPQYYDWFNLETPGYRTNIHRPPGAPAPDNRGFAAALSAPLGSVFIANSLAVGVHRAAMALTTQMYDIIREEDGKFVVTVELKPVTGPTTLLFDVKFMRSSESAVEFEEVKLRLVMDGESMVADEAWGSDEQRDIVRQAVEEIGGMAAQDVILHWARPGVLNDHQIDARR